MAGVNASAANPITDGVPDKPIENPTELPEELLSEIGSKWSLQIDEELYDCEGNAYFPKHVDEKSNDTTLCGAFPHALCKNKTGPQAGKIHHMFGGCHEIMLDVVLQHNGGTYDGALTPEAYLMSKIKKAVPEEEQARWGRYESALGFHARLVFDDGSLVRPYGFHQGGDFREAPRNSHLLHPAEHPLGYAGYYEQEMHGGRLGWQFCTEKGMTSAKLTQDKKARLFRIVVEPTNPYLKGVAALTATSTPFIVKAHLGNDLAANERYVTLARDTTLPSGDAQTAGTVVTCPSKPRRYPPLSVNRKY